MAAKREQGMHGCYGMTCRGWCRDRPSMPFRCLDAQYRRELVRVYLTNVETICRKFVDERREALARLRDDSAGLRNFWAHLGAQQRQAFYKHLH